MMVWACNHPLPNLASGVRAADVQRSNVGWLQLGIRALPSPLPGSHLSSLALQRPLLLPRLQETRDVRRGHPEPERWHRGRH